MYYHRCILSPTISTLISVIDNNFFTTWLGLTSPAVKKIPDKDKGKSKDPHEPVVPKHPVNEDFTPHRSCIKQEAHTSPIEDHYYTI